MGDDRPKRTRRERLRQETIAELRQAALVEVREHGAVGLSLRRVARRMGMSPAGLYRYVTSREDLLTRLITGSYDDLADHLLTALAADRAELAEPDRSAAPPPLVARPDTDVADRLRAVALAYRHWGVVHPNEFGLLFGDPIPGYAAPPAGPTTEAMARVGVALALPLVEAWTQGRLRVPTPLDDPALTAPLAPMADLAPGLPSGVHALMLTIWGRLHGHVSLEVFGHHAWLFPDGCEPLYRAEVEALLADHGVTA